MQGLFQDRAIRLAKPLVSAFGVERVDSKNAVAQFKLRSNPSPYALALAAL